MQYAPLPDFLLQPATAMVVAPPPGMDEPPEWPAGCWLESGIDLQAGLQVQEELDMTLFELWQYGASLPRAEGYSRTNLN